MEIPDFFASLREYLRAYKRLEIRDASLTPSAVLIPLLARGNEFKELTIVFIRRSDDSRYHAGQVAFPGGRAEPFERNLIQTAVREAREEIGLQLENIDILGMLDDFVTLKSNFNITPVIAKINQREFKRQQEEVADIFEVPVAHLLDAHNSGYRDWEHKGRVYRVKEYYYKKRLIWGATARILEKLLSIFSQILGKLT